MINNYMGKVNTIKTFDDRSIAARIINENAESILIENSKGFRGTIFKNNIVSITPMKNVAINVELISKKVG